MYLPALRAKNKCKHLFLICRLTARALWAHLQAEKCFFAGGAGKKTYLSLFHHLRMAKLCEAFFEII